MYNFTPTPRPQVESRLRRIVDLTVPNLARMTQDERFETRSNRVIPVLVCPWEADKPVTEEHLFALTKDLSSDSVGVVLPQPIRTSSVVVGFWLGADVMDDPWYFLGRPRSLRRLGGGFWTAGVQFTEVLGAAARDALAPLAPLAARLSAPPLVELVGNEIVGQ